MDLQSLETEQLQRLYQLQRAMLRGGDPDEIAIPEGKDNDFFIRSIERSSAAIARNTALGDVDDVSEDRTTTISQWQNSARRALDGSASADDLLLVDALANGVYGYPFDASNGINEAETAYLEEILRNQERGQGLGQMQASGERATAAFERAAAQAEAEEARNAAELARIEQEAARELLTLEAASAALGYGTVDGALAHTDNTEIAGFNGGTHELDRIVANNHESLQRHFRDNIIDIREQMYTTDPETGEMIPTEFATEVMTYLVSEGDFRGDISAMLQSGDDAQISQAQAILRLSGHEDVQITGEVDLLTANAAIEYIETPRALGDTTLRYAPRGVEPEVDTNAIFQNVNRGNITDFTQLSAEQLATLPPQFAELASDLEGLDAQTRAEEVALFLSDRENYDAYNQYLETAPASPEMTAAVTTLQGNLATLTEEAERAAALDSVLTDRFQTAAFISPAASPLAVERVATIEAQVEAGNLDGAIQTATAHIDARLSVLETEQVALVQGSLDSFQDIPSLAGMSAEEIVATLNNPDTTGEAYSDIHVHGSADIRTMIYSGGTLNTRMSEYRELTAIKQEIIDGMTPADAAPAEAPLDAPEGPVEDADPAFVAAAEPVDTTITGTDVVNNPAGLRVGADLEVAADNIDMAVPGDVIAADDDFARFSSPDLSLAVLSERVYLHADRIGERMPGADINAGNITFRQFIETEFAGSQWYDGVYGSEFNAGDRTMIDAVVGEGLPLEEAAQRAGLDPDAVMDLEDPSALAQFTEATFLATRGQGFDATPYTPEQLLNAAHRGLYMDVPEPDEAPAAEAGTPVASANLVTPFQTAALHELPEASIPGAGATVIPDRAAAMRIDLG